MNEIFRTAARPPDRRAQRDRRASRACCRRARSTRFPTSRRSRTTTARWRSSCSEEGGVACGGGSSFGAAGKGYLRFSYAASLEDIDWALQSICSTLPNSKAELNPGSRSNGIQPSRDFLSRPHRLRRARVPIRTRNTSSARLPVALLIVCLAPPAILTPALGQTVLVPNGNPIKSR